MYDVLAALPFDYILMPFKSYGLGNDLLRLIRILKFFKVMTLIQTITVIRMNSNIPKAIITFSLLIFLFCFLGHIMATSYILIGSLEVGKKSRFDGQTMFGDITNRNFITPDEALPDKNFEFLKPAE